MRLFFTVPDTLQTQNGVLLRNFLRQCAVSTDLARAVKFRGSGFFAEGEPVLANRRVYPGQFKYEQSIQDAVRALHTE